MQEILTLIDYSDRIFCYGTGYGQELMLREFARCMLNLHVYIKVIPDRYELKLIKQTLKQDDFLNQTSFCTLNLALTLLYENFLIILIIK